MLRSFLIAPSTRLRLRLPPDWLNTWWERVLAGIAIALVLAFVASIIEDC
jgi:hypothetical protein